MTSNEVSSRYETSLRITGIFFCQGGFTLARLSVDGIGAILCVIMRALRKTNLLPANVALLVLVSLVSCLIPTTAQVPSHSFPVDLVPIDVDSKNPERKKFDALTLLSAFQLQSKDKRFGGLSGLSIGNDGKLYTVSDRGFWLSASMSMNPDGTLVNLSDWRIAPILTATKTPVAGALRDAEALARDRVGSFLIAFEGTHRIWRYPPPPEAFQSAPSPVQIPSAVSRAPSNGGIEALTVLPDGRLLAITEEFENPDGSFKGWLLDKGQSAELSYVPAEGFRVTDCAALDNGDVLVLERRYMLFGILSARVTLVKADSLKPGAKLVGKELLKLEQPLATENYEGIAAKRTPQGTIIFIVSDDNYGSFQRTLLLQFLLPDANN
jgi:hypothetical protein